MEATPQRTFSDLMAAQMAALNITDDALARRIGVSRVSVLRHRNGETMPPLSLGMAYSRVLQIPAARLLQAAATQGGE